MSRVPSCRKTGHVLLHASKTCRIPIWELTIVNTPDTNALCAHCDGFLFTCIYVHDIMNHNLL